LKSQFANIERAKRVYQAMKMRGSSQGNGRLAVELGISPAASPNGSRGMQCVGKCLRLPICSIFAWIGRLNGRNSPIADNGNQLKRYRIDLLFDAPAAS